MLIGVLALLFLGGKNQTPAEKQAEAIWNQFRARRQEVPAWNAVEPGFRERATAIVTAGPSRAAEFPVLIEDAVAVARVSGGRR